MDLDGPAKSPRVQPRAADESDLLALARSEPEIMAERLALAMEAAGAGVYATDRVAGTFWCSDEFVRIIGRRLTAEEALGHLWPIHHPDDIPHVEQVIEAARAGVGDATGPDVAFEARVLLPDGGVRWVEWRVKKAYDPDGSLVGVVGIIFDIDERKRQEAAVIEARREAEANAARLNLSMRASGGGAFEVDYDARTFWCSPEYEAIVGRTMTYEDIARPVWEFTHPDDVELIKVHIATHRGEFLEPAESRVVLPSGESRWVRTNGYLHWKSGEDRPRKVVGFIQDIDERKRQELVLEEARARQEVMANRLKLSVDAAGAGVFEIDLVAETFWCSPEYADIVGRPLTYEEASGPWPMCHPDDVETVREMMRKPRRDGEIGQLEWRIIRPNGEVRWIDGRWLIHRAPTGELIKITGQVSDADDRKRQELALIEAERAASAAAEAKSQFLANMSHEIRTPMNGVLGILGLLGRENLSDEGRRMLAEAEGCGRMLAQLLNDVIDLSKIDAGRLELAPEAVDVGAVLTSVAELLRPQAEIKGVELQIEIGGGDGWAMIDPVRLRQALFNLVGNAIKFTPSGHVAARLAIGEDGPGAKRLRFEIEDTGVGISPQAQARLFQRFQQADGSTARQFGGSGLGLSITRSLAEMMGGHVGFTSEEGRGSTFWIDVPALAAEPPQPIADEALAGLDGLRILVVEDNATNRLVATKILEGLGAQVRTAEDGVLGVEAVEAVPFDLVLMDVQMPRMDGVEATQHIRAMSGPRSAIPIIGLTANAMPHQWQAYREAGMDGVTAKPIVPAALLTEIARVLAARDQVELVPRARAGGSAR